jgi:uncharacterized membrane protein HdeD (DUF308 family)
MNSHRHKPTPKPGIGLYTYEQSENATPFQYAVQIVVGVIFFTLGIVATVAARYVVGIGSIVIGVFLAHAGTIFWWKRLKK